MEAFFFIPENQMEIFFNKIKSKYNCNFRAILDYFSTTFLNKYSFRDNEWNFHKIAFGITGENNLFFTNNIIESYQ